MGVGLMANLENLENLENQLCIGAKVRIGKQCALKYGYEEGQVLTLVQGYFEHDNGLYAEPQTCPSIWNEAEQDFDSIYHLWENDLSGFLDCEIIKDKNVSKKEKMSEANRVRKDKTATIKCSCYSEILELAYDAELDLIDLAIFERGSYENHKMSFKNKLRYCLQILFKGKPFGDQMVLQKEQIWELREFLKSIDLKGEFPEHCYWEKVYTTLKENTGENTGENEPKRAYSSCNSSRGICGSLTFGDGELDYNGYWEFPNNQAAREWEEDYPEDGECWPFKFKDKNKFNTPEIHRQAVNVWNTLPLRKYCEVQYLVKLCGVDTRIGPKEAAKVNTTIFENSEPRIVDATKED